MNVELMRLPRVLTATGLSRSRLYALVNEGKFPAPIKLIPGPRSRSVAWPSDLVAEWIEARIRASCEGIAR